MDILSITNKESVSADAKVYTKDGNDFVTTTFDALYNNSSAKTNIEKSVSDANARIDTTNNTVAELDNYARAKGNGIVLQSQGEMVTVNDSSDDYVVNLKPYGKSEQDSTTGKNQLENTATTKEISGVFFTVNNNKSVTLKGISTTENPFFYLNDNITLKKGSYILSGGTLGETFVRLIDRDSDSVIAQTNDGEVTFTLDKDTVCEVYLRTQGNYTFNGETFYPMIRKAEITDATYEPYTGGQPSPSPQYEQEIRSTVISELRSCGKNLFDVFAWKSGQPDSDGWVTLSYDNTSSTTSRQLYLLTAVSEFLLANTQYRVVVEVESISNAALRAVSHEKSSQFAEELKITKVGKYFSTIRTKNDFSESTNMLRTYLSISAGVSGSAKFRISVLENTSITADTFVYEPYTETVAQLSEPITLYGIATDSVGNYTDSNGQQWIADYIDVERGKVVRNVNNYIINGTEPMAIFGEYGGISIGNIRGRMVHVLSNVAVYAKGTDLYSGKRYGVSCNFAYNQIVFRLEGLTTVDEYRAKFLEMYNNGTPAIVYHTLATPTEEDLPTADVVALRNLKTFYSVTNVTNDSEVKGEMVLSYNADTKMYIDNKFAELAAQLV